MTGSAAEYFASLRKYYSILGWTKQGPLVDRAMAGLSEALKDKVVRNPYPFESIDQLALYCVPLDNRIRARRQEKEEARRARDEKNNSNSNRNQHSKNSSHSQSQAHSRSHSKPSFSSNSNPTPSTSNPVPVAVVRTQSPADVNGWNSNSSPYPKLT